MIFGVKQSGSSRPNHERTGDDVAMTVTQDRFPELIEEAWKLVDEGRFT